MTASVGNSNDNHRKEEPEPTLLIERCEYFAEDLMQGQQGQYNVDGFCSPKNQKEQPIIVTHRESENRKNYGRADIQEKEREFAIGLAPDQNNRQPCRRD